MEFPANDVQVLYTKFQDAWNLHISLLHSRNLNYCTVPSYWTSGIWHREMVLLSPCSQIHCLFLSSPDKEEHTASLITQEVSQIVFSSNYLQLQVCGLIILWSNLISATHIQMPQEMYMNGLNMSFGINYKFSGLLHHNLKRVWVVKKIAIPKLEDIHFPDINFDPDCKFTRKLNNARQAAEYEIQSICKSIKPLISLLKQRERHYENAIKALLKEEIPRSLPDSGHSQSSRSNQVPVSAGQRFLHNTIEGGVPVPVCKKRAVPALVPALASLVMIAVESLNSFLHKK